MGIRYEAHSDLCGCDRCAKQYETAHPQQVFDRIEDPNWCTTCQNDLDHCRCAEYSAYEDEYYADKD